ALCGPPCRARGHPHSFPTRRSSDLGRAQKKVLIVLSDGGDNASMRTFEDVLEMARRSDTVIYTIGMNDQYDEDADPDVLKELARDRKSTRLNSSHVKISYAVFCLKK